MQKVFILTRIYMPIFR